MKELRGFTEEKQTDNEKIYLETPKLVNNRLCALGTRKKGAYHILTALMCQSSLDALCISE